MSYWRSWRRNGRRQAQPASARRYLTVTDIVNNPALACTRAQLTDAAIVFEKQKKDPTLINRSGVYYVFKNKMLAMDAVGYPFETSATSP
jgi:hypothetical protein